MKATCSSPRIIYLELQMTQVEARNLHAMLAHFVDGNVQEYEEVAVAIIDQLQPELQK